MKVESLAHKVKNLLKIRDYRVLFENFTALSFLQITNSLLPLVTLPYLVRVLGSEKFGLVFFAQSFIHYFKTFTEFGFNLSAVREISVSREDVRKCSEIFSSVTIIKLIFMVLSFIIMLVIIFTFNKFRHEWLVFVFTFGIVIGDVLFSEWFFQGVEKMRYITVVNIMAKLIFTILIFLLIKKKSDYILVPVINSLGFLIAGCYSFWVIFKKFKIKIFFPGKKALIKFTKDSMQFFWSRASYSVYTTSNAFILGLVTNNTIVGFYVAAEKIYKAIRFMYQPIVRVLYPYMSRSKNKILFKKIFWTIITLNSISCLLLVLVSKKLVVLIFGTEFQSSAIIFLCFMIALFFVVPSILLGYPLLAAFGKANYANNSVIIGSVFHLTVLIIISQIYIEAYIVSLLVVLTEIIVLSIRCYGIKKYKLWRVE